MGADTSWCPSCGVEYVAGRTSCVDCGLGLVGVPPAWADAALDEADARWLAAGWLERFRARRRLGPGEAFRVASVGQFEPPMLGELWVRTAKAIIYMLVGAPGNRIEVANGLAARPPQDDR